MMSYLYIHRCVHTASSKIFTGADLVGAVLHVTHVPVHIHYYAHQTSAISYRLSYEDSPDPVYNPYGFKTFDSDIWFPLLFVSNLDTLLLRVNCGVSGSPEAANAWYKLAVAESDIPAIELARTLATVNL